MALEDSKQFFKSVTKGNVHDDHVNVKLLLFLWNHNNQTKRGLLVNVFVLSTKVRKFAHYI